VGGFLFEHGHPIEHWWVYDSDKKQHIEVSPIIGDANIIAYAGIIEFDLNYDDFKNTKEWWDIDFLKGGNVYHTYFK
jgi:hypothetical protein